MTFMQMLEAARSGKRVRKGNTGGFVIANTLSFSYDDTQYTGWEVETEVPKSVTLSLLKNAWNAARPTGGSVAVAETSEFFKRLASTLGYEI